MTILKRILLFTLGIFISSYSLMFIIIYINLFKMGYNFIDYIKYIFTHTECLLIYIGLLMIIISLKKVNKKEKRIKTINRRKNEKNTNSFNDNNFISM